MRHVIPLIVAAAIGFGAVRAGWSQEKPDPSVGAADHSVDPAGAGTDPVPEVPPDENPDPAPGTSAGTVLDFDRFEAEVRGGFLWFSGDFEANAEACGGILVRVPMPWLSRRVFGFAEDRFGLFAAATVGSIARDITPELEDPDGTLLFADAGIDFDVVRDDTWLLAIRAGYQYADYGGVTHLQDGSGFVSGLTAGVRLVGDLRMTYSPAVVFGHAGDRIVFNTLGIRCQF